MPQTVNDAGPNPGSLLAPVSRVADRILVGPIDPGRVGLAGGQLMIERLVHEGQGRLPHAAGVTSDGRYEAAAQGGFVTLVGADRAVARAAQEVAGVGVGASRHPALPDRAAPCARRSRPTWRPRERPGAPRPPQTMKVGAHAATGWIQVLASCGHSGPCNLRTFAGGAQTPERGHVTDRLRSAILPSQAWRISC